jgi:hypothetical protein
MKIGINLEEKDSGVFYCWVSAVMEPGVLVAALLLPRREGTEGAALRLLLATVPQVGALAWVSAWVSAWALLLPYASPSLLFSLLSSLSWAKFCTFTRTVLDDQ